MGCALNRSDTYHEIIYKNHSIDWGDWLRSWRRRYYFSPHWWTTSYYNNFVVTLDLTPPENLTVDYVITRLLNEESRQDGVSSPNHDIFENVAASVQAVDSARRPKRTLAFITCFGCGKKGHYQANCPTRKAQTTETANAVFAVTETDDDDEWWILDLKGCCFYSIFYLDIFVYHPLMFEGVC